MLSAKTNTRALISALFGCGNAKQIKEVHARSITSSMIENLVFANKLLYSYVHHRSLDDVRTLFSSMRERNNVSWSVMVSGFAKLGDYSSCLDTFRSFIRSGGCVDNYIVPSALRACRDTLSIRVGGEVHQLVCKSGLEFDVYVSAALVDMYSKCGNIEGARKVFDEMGNRDLVTWTSLIGGYAECGDPEVSLAMFDRMLEERVVPDTITMVTVVFGCAKLGLMCKAKMIHEYIIKKKFPLNVILGTALIDMYAKCGSIDASRDIFEKMEEKNVVSWSSMMSAYAFHGRGREAIDLFHHMLHSGIRPNRVSFLSVLYACSHAGMIDEGRKFFYAMERDYLVVPDLKHYTCMVDLLGRAGKLDESLELAENMKIEKDEGFWGALLGACSIHGDIESAKKASVGILELCPRNPGHYVLISNVFASARMWNEVANVRELMSRRRIKKVPGWSWIEIDDEAYQFKVGDKSHPRSKEIHEMLVILGENLEQTGYIPEKNISSQHNMIRPGGPCEDEELVPLLFSATAGRYKVCKASASCQEDRGS